MGTKTLVGTPDPEEPTPLPVPAIACNGVTAHVVWTATSEFTFQTYVNGTLYTGTTR